MLLIRPQDPETITQDFLISITNTTWKLSPETGVKSTVSLPRRKRNPNFPMLVHIILCLRIVKHSANYSKRAKTKRIKTKLSTSEHLRDSRRSKRMIPTISQAPVNTDFCAPGTASFLLVRSMTAKITTGWINWQRVSQRVSTILESEIRLCNIVFYSNALTFLKS